MHCKFLSLLIISLSISLGALGLPASAAPRPLGLELGKATVEDLNSHYKTRYRGRDEVNHGPLFSIEIDKVGLDRIKFAFCGFNQNKVLQWCHLEFNYHRQPTFEELIEKRFGDDKEDYYLILRDALTKKYPQYEESSSPDGDRSTRFTEQGGRIILAHRVRHHDLVLLYFTPGYDELRKQHEQQRGQAPALPDLDLL